MNNIMSKTKNILLVPAVVLPLYLMLFETGLAKFGFESWCWTYYKES